MQVESIINPVSEHPRCVTRLRKGLFFCPKFLDDPIPCDVEYCESCGFGAGCKFLATCEQYKKNKVK